MLQLTLNPALQRADLVRIRDAIAAQISPSSHAYVFGESLRLMTPIVYMARRGAFAREEWTAWFREIAAPTPFPSWEGAFSSEPMLRKRHNLVSFVTAIYAAAQLSENRDDDVLLEGAAEAFHTIP